MSMEPPDDCECIDEDRPGEKLWLCGSIKCKIRKTINGFNALDILRNRLRKRNNEED